MKIQNTGKILPAGSTQHKTAGPYSPVLEVDASRIVVISGQAPIDKAGNVVGSTIEEQTICTLQNCKEQLQSAKVGFANVFKVNVYLTNLALWQRFNKIYEQRMPKPFPVRTAVQAGLLLSFLVEIEMWASKPNI